MAPPVISFHRGTSQLAKLITPPSHPWSFTARTHTHTQTHASILSLHILSKSVYSAGGGCAHARRGGHCTAAWGGRRVWRAGCGCVAADEPGVCASMPVWGGGWHLCRVAVLPCPNPLTLLLSPPPIPPVPLPVAPHAPNPPAFPCPTSSLIPLSIVQCHSSYRCTRTEPLHSGW